MIKPKLVENTYMDDKKPTIMLVADIPDIEFAFVALVVGFEKVSKRWICKNPDLSTFYSNFAFEVPNKIDINIAVEILNHTCYSNKDLLSNRTFSQSNWNFFLGDIFGYATEKDSDTVLFMRYMCGVWQISCEIPFPKKAFADIIRVLNMSKNKIVIN